MARGDNERERLRRVRWLDAVKARYELQTRTILLEEIQEHLMELSDEDRLWIEDHDPPVQQQEPIAPPSSLLLALLLPPKEHEDFLGNLAELYQLMVERHGRRRANFWWYTQGYRRVFALTVDYILSVWNRIVSIKLS